MVLVEIFLFIQMGEMIGGFETILLVVLTGVFGMHILRNPNIASIQKIMEQMKYEQQTGINITHSPVLLSEPIIESFLVFIAGFLLIIPGFLTDFLGLIAFFPLSRMFLVRRFNKYFIKPSVSANDQFIEAEYRHDNEGDKK